MINNICFILTPTENNFHYPKQLSLLSLSLALGVLAGYLRKKGLEVDMFDLNPTLSQKFGEAAQKSRFEVFFNRDLVLSYIQNADNDQIDSLIENMLDGIDLNQYDSFGISIGGDFSYIQIHSGFMIGSYLQKKYHKPVFFGGNNITYLYIFREVYHEFWQTVLKQFSFIVKGAGEQAIWDFITTLNNNEDPAKLNSFNGLIRLAGDRVVANPEYKPQVIRPDWDGLILEYYYRYMRDDTGTGDLAERAAKDNTIYFYKWPNSSMDSPGQLANKFNKLKRQKMNPRLILPYIFNYNCPYNCAFCTQSDVERAELVIGEATAVLDDIIALKDKYQTNYFYFFNNAFNYSGKFVDEFCQKVLDEGVKFYWSDCARFNNLTYDRLKLMRDAGCVKLTFGCESGSEKVLQLIDKKINLAQGEQVLKWCHELGIWADIEVIIGFPQEFDEDFLDTCKFIKQNSKSINYFWINEYFILPDSLIGRFPERYGIELIKDRNDYNKLLEKNLASFQNGELLSNRNAKIYGFNEIGGRLYQDILNANKRNLITISTLQNKEFGEASHFYQMLVR
jgi:radical SAM superfamily enzyme YgiQ (UPF0313 family)